MDHPRRASVSAFGFGGSNFHSVLEEGPHYFFTMEFVDGRPLAEALPAGGMELDARYTIETNDGELIIVRNCGLASGLVPVFETRVDGKYAYLNDGLWLSSSPGIGVA